MTDTSHFSVLNESISFSSSYKKEKKSRDIHENVKESTKIQRSFVHTHANHGRPSSFDRNNVGPIKFGEESEEDNYNKP